MKHVKVILRSGAVFRVGLPEDLAKLEVWEGVPDVVAEAESRRVQDLPLS